MLTVCAMIMSTPIFAFAGKKQTSLAYLKQSLVQNEGKKTQAKVRQGQKAAAENAGRFTTEAVKKHVLGWPKLRELQPVLAGEGGKPDPRIDPWISVGGDTILTTVTSSAAILDRETLIEITSFSLVGTDEKPGLFKISDYPQLENYPLVADPNSVYDERTGLFFIVAYNPFLTPGKADIFLAVSKTSTPRSVDDWNTFNTQVDGIDFPIVAVDDDAVYLGAYSYVNTGGLLLAYDLQKILSNTGMELIYDSGPLGIYSFKGYVRPIQPTRDCCGKIGKVVMLQPTTFEDYDFFAQGDTLRLLRVENVGTPAANLVIRDIKVPYYVGGSDFGTPSIPQLPPQFNPNNVGLNAFRPFTISFLGSATLRGDKIWAAHVAFSQSSNFERTVVRWYEIDDANTSLLQVGNVDNGTTNALYAGVNVDNQGNMGLVMTHSDSSSYHTLSYTGRFKHDPKGTVRMPLQYVSGGDLYLQRPQPFNGVGESIGIVPGGNKKQHFYVFGVDAIQQPSVPGFNLPITFEGQTVQFADFNGSNTSVISNPDMSGINTSATVAQNIVPAGAAFAGAFMDVADPLDISTHKVFKMKVWSPIPNLPVLLKLEDGMGGFSEVLSTVTNANVWEELEFDFTGKPELVYNRVVILMNFNVVAGQNYTYYWDDLVQVGAPISIPENLSPFGTNLSSTLGVFSMEKGEKSTLLNSPQTEFLIPQNEYINGSSKRASSKLSKPKIDTKGNVEIQPMFGKKS